MHEVSLLLQYLASPRMGHLMQTINIFFYLDEHARSWLVMDPVSFDVDWTPIGNELSPEYKAQLMKEPYPDALEEMPHNALEPLG